MGQRQSFVGLLVAGHQVVPLGLLYTYFTLALVYLPINRAKLLTLSHRRLMSSGVGVGIFEGVPLGQGSDRVTITTNASYSGWGVVNKWRSIFYQ